MKKMAGVLAAVAVAGILVYSAFNIYENSKNIDTITYYSENDFKVEIQKIPLNQLREEYQNDIQEVRDGKYVNLTTAHPYVYITDADSLSGIHEKSNDRFNELSLLELVQSEYEVIKSLIGDDLDMEELVDDSSWYTEGDELLYPTYEETVQKIKDGNYKVNEKNEWYCTRPYLAYIGATKAGGDSKYCHVPPDMDYVVFMRGKLFELLGLVTDELESMYVADKVYYKDGENLDDEYPLSNGMLSIGDAIDYVEEYFADLYPYNMHPDIKQKVHHVEVFDIGNGINAYEFAMVRQFGGLNTDTGYVNELADPEVRDCTRVIMVETDAIDMRVGTGNGCVMEKIGEEFSEVVSLKTALEIISANIGKNSKYEITEISMIIRRETNNGTLYQLDYTGRPCWLIRCINAADGKEIRFYINLEDGKFDYVRSVTMYQH